MNFSTLPGAITLNSVDGATLPLSGAEIYPDGAYYRGVNAFGAHHVNVSGGRIQSEIHGYDNSTITISGGMLIGYDASHQNSRFTITGGTFSYYVDAWDNSTIYISGEAIIKRGLNAYDTSTISVVGLLTVSSRTKIVFST